MEEIKKKRTPYICAIFFAIALIGADVIAALLEEQSVIALGLLLSLLISIIAFIILLLSLRHGGPNVSHHWLIAFFFLTVTLFFWRLANLSFAFTHDLSSSTPVEEPELPFFLDTNKSQN